MADPIIYRLVVLHGLKSGNDVQKPGNRCCDGEKYEKDDGQVITDS